MYDICEKDLFVVLVTFLHLIKHNQSQAKITIQVAQNHLESYSYFHPAVEMSPT